MSKTIRWDDPSYATRQAKEDSSSNEQLPIVNAMANLLPQSVNSQSIATSTSWRELTSRDGRKYYFNAVTQKTVWEMPQEYREYLEFSRGEVVRKPAIVSDEAFWAVLRERQVTSKFSWEEALRAIITHPNYKCIPSLQERKASFTRFCEAMRAYEQEEERLQLEAKKEAFTAVLLTDARVDSRSSWQQIIDWYGESEVFKAIESSRNRLDVFDTVIAQLKEEEAAGLAKRRNSNFVLVSDLLKEMNVVLDTSKGTFPDWRQIKPVLVEKASSVPELAQLDPSELFKAFHDYLQAQFEDFERQRKQSREYHLQKEFRLRERFCYFLRSLSEDGRMTPFSTWANLYLSHLKGVAEYEEFVGIYLYGTTPLDSFYLVLNELQQRYSTDRVIIAEFLKAQYGSANRDSLPSKLKRINRFQDELAVLNEKLQDSHSISYAFEELFPSSSSQPEPTREQIDAYKYFLKHLNPQITLRDRWSGIKERLQGLPEYEAMTDELREAYFYKYLKWLDGRESKRSRSSENTSRNYHK